MKPIAALAATLCLAACAAPAGFERNDARFELIRPGMTRDDAMRLFGRPDETMRFPMTATESWDYLYYDTWGVLASYSVTFGADGRVVTRFSRRLNDGGDHGQ